MIAKKSLTAFALLWPALLSSCATAPTVPQPVPCPVPPALSPMPSAVTEASFTDRMLLFLSGKLPDLISSESNLPNAKHDTKQPSAR